MEEMLKKLQNKNFNSVEEEPDYSSYGIKKEAIKRYSRLYIAISKIASRYSSSDMIDYIMSEIEYAKDSSKVSEILSRYHAPGDMEEDFIEEVKTYIESL